MNNKTIEGLKEACERYVNARNKVAQMLKGDLSRKNMEEWLYARNEEDDAKHKYGLLALKKVPHLLSHIDELEAKNKVLHDRAHRRGIVLESLSKNNNIPKTFRDMMHTAYMPKEDKDEKD